MKLKTIACRAPSIRPHLVEKCMMVGRGRLTASPRGKMHDGNGLRDQCAVGNGLLDSLMHDGNGLKEFRLLSSKVVNSIGVLFF